MAKRFSTKETTLLMVPVAAIGAISLWVSKRPAPMFDDGKPHLTFRIAKPTALQAFEGNDAVLIFATQDADGNSYWLRNFSRWLEVHTPQGVDNSRNKAKSSLPWAKVPYGVGYTDTLLIPGRFLPPGEVYFRYQAVAMPLSMVINGKPKLKPQPVSGEWKIDRAQIHPLNLASWPRKPLISLREVKISRVDKQSSEPTCEAIFQFDPSIMNQRRTLVTDIHSRDSRILWTDVSGPVFHKSLQRMVVWTVYSPKNSNSFVHVSGRASADNRWPLGFEIEPFNFKTAKIGQKLKFKQFPLPLPR